MLVVMRLGETPVPIPNTMVKPQTADGTALETVWESRWPPATKKKNVIRDMRFEENFRFHMTDKKISQKCRHYTSQPGCSVACRHANQSIQNRLMKASFQRRF